MNTAQKSATVSGCYLEHNHGVVRPLTVYFKKTDSGRSISRRARQINDCTVRALAAATDTPYDAAYDLLAEAGRKCSRGFHFRAWAVNAEVNGYTFRWRPFQAVKGQDRMNPAKFCTEFNQGRWIVRTAKHVMAVIDGVVHDTIAPSPVRCIYGAWECVKS